MPKPNRLVNEKSPYLLKHAYNPVDWYPWGEEAFEKALREDKPIFLSIGYYSCHWCMVMERESFEDEEIARIINEHFVPIKVDREERPDIDHFYMTACQAMTGQGGWPLNVFLTPDKKPFFAGTYFPKESQYGLPGFKDLLLHIARLWRENREAIVSTAQKVSEGLKGLAVSLPEDTLSQSSLRLAYHALAANFDSKYGGFGKAPKFPIPHHIYFLLRWWLREKDPRALEMATYTLTKMSQGGIWDHLGYGFHRYSVDEKWRVPHFEKMLYDQALLAIAYLETYQVTKNELFARVASQIFEYVLRDMLSPEGAFFSSESADTNGKEGLFYVWTPAEIKNILGEKAGALFCRLYGVTEEGNFEGGKSVLHLNLSLEEFAKEEGLKPEELASLIEKARKALFEARLKRPRPPKDDKILTDWNGLMIAALALGSRVLKNTKYLEAAKKASYFINHYMADGPRLFHRFCHGETAISGLLTDYAFFVWGLIELYESSFDVRYLEQAVSLSRQMIKNFWDEKEGGFFLSLSEDLLQPSKDYYDGAIPSGNAVAAWVLLRLSHLLGDPFFDDIGQKALRSAAGFIKQAPLGFTAHLCALDFALGPVTEVVIAGEPEDQKTRQMLATIWEKFLPRTVVLLNPKDAERLKTLAPWLKKQAQISGEPTAYVCRNFSCSLPTTDISALAKKLEE